MSYTYDYEIEQYGTEPAPITQMPIQNIPVTNTNAQQYPDVSSILRENEQLKAMVANFEQKLASHQLPPKAHRAPGVTRVISITPKCFVCLSNHLVCAYQA